MSSRRFEEKEHTIYYKTYRPIYPTVLKRSILDYLKGVNPSCIFESILDVGCGSGQATLMWKDDFKLVHGTDISEKQIDQAPYIYNNVKFSVGSGEKLEFPDHSMDLITVAQAMHWMNVERFYEEVTRVLKPGGVLAAFGHNYRELRMDNERATDIVLHEFETKHLRAGGYWAKQRAYAENYYRDFTFPLQQFKRMELSNTIKVWTVDHLVGLLASYSAYQSYISDNPTSTILKETQDKLEDIYKGEKPRITIPIFLLLGQKSK